MDVRGKSVKIEEDRPFENCKLGRKKYAEALTNIIKNTPKGFVLAVNNEWGTGKTTFIKMWQKQLDNNKFRTIYFNAWENDFSKDALISILSELDELNGASGALLKKALEKAKPLLKSIPKAILKGVIGKYIELEYIKEATSDLVDDISEVENEINEYKARKKSIVEFKQELSKYISDGDNGTVVFFVDELDRCRPSYAVEVLETIKHLFSVDGIVFVLSIDKQQFCCAIKGVYGSESLNAEEYLRRFIDIEYSIPSPDTASFCEYLYDAYDFQTFIESPERLNDAELKFDKNSFLTFSTFLFAQKNIPLRAQEKIFAHARIALLSFNSNNYLLPTCFIFLIYLKLNKGEMYRKLSTLKYDLLGLIKDVVDELDYTEKDGDSEFSDLKRSLGQLHAYLVILYNNSFPLQSRVRYSDLKGYSFGSRNVNDNVNLVFGGISNRSNIGEMNIHNLIDKIDLLENVKVDTD
jgi:Predicted P-loop ATPase